MQTFASYMEEGVIREAVMEKPKLVERIKRVVS